MRKMHRREFLDQGNKIAMASGIMAIPLMDQGKDPLEKTFLHHVFFWLKEPDAPFKIQAFEKSLRNLVTIDSIRQFHLGKPASTRREVIDSTYHYSLLTMFNNKSDHDQYQIHPVHDEFRKVASDLCSKILIYDSINIQAV